MPVRFFTAERNSFLPGFPRQTETGSIPQNLRLVLRINQILHNIVRHSPDPVFHGNEIFFRIGIKSRIVDRHRDDRHILRQSQSFPETASERQVVFRQMHQQPVELFFPVKIRNQPGLIAFLLQVQRKTPQTESGAFIGKTRQQLAENDRIIRNRDSIPGADDRQNARCCGCSGIPATVC